MCFYICNKTSSSFVSRNGAVGWIEHWLKMPKSAPRYDVLRPLTASTASEVKNDHAYVITQDICNKFIEIQFSVGCMYGLGVMLIKQHPKYTYQFK